MSTDKFATRLLRASPKMTKPSSIDEGFLLIFYK